MASASQNLMYPDPARQSPPEPFDECVSCRGWGIVLGTDSPEFWGQACTCGRPYHRPATVAQAQELHAAHMQARLRKEARS